MQLNKQELEVLPERIDRLEAELHQLQLEMSGSTFYQQEETTIVNAVERMKSLEEDLAASYLRWQELEKIVNEMSVFLE